MAVEEIFAPLGAVLFVCHLCINTHDCRENLGDEEDDEADAEGWTVVVFGVALDSCQRWPHAHWSSIVVFYLGLRIGVCGQYHPKGE